MPWRLHSYGHRCGECSSKASLSECTWSPAAHVIEYSFRRRRGTGDSLRGTGLCSSSFSSSLPKQHPPSGFISTSICRMSPRQTSDKLYTNSGTLHDLSMFRRYFLHIGYIGLNTNMLPTVHHHPGTDGHSQRFLCAQICIISYFISSVHRYTAAGSSTIGRGSSWLYPSSFGLARWPSWVSSSTSTPP